MQWYAKFGFRRFVLCLGFKSEIIKDYFLNYHTMNSDFTVDLKSNHLQIHSVDHEQDWEVTLAFTGEDTMTGGRIARAARRYLGDSPYAGVTYGDGLCNVDLLDEFRFHRKQDQLGTVLGVNPPSRFGELKVENDRVQEFAEKPNFTDSWINGGYFFFKRNFFFDYLSTSQECIIEREPLINLTADNQLNLYRHEGFWSCMDTQRDRDALTKLWESSKAPWSPSAKAATNTKILQDSGVK
jgi:glucose-1-phosphate cytidylyltransferase